MNSAWNNFFGSEAKKQRTSGGSSAPSGAAGSSGTAGTSSAAASAQPQQSAAPKTYAQASRAAGKRTNPAPPTFQRPGLVRGPPIFQHPDYLSMERPAPPSPNPIVLYVDMRSSKLIPEDVLDAAYDVVGKAVYAFDVFAAQKTLALAFSKAEDANRFKDKPIGDTGLDMYAAPPEPTELVRLTLQGVPTYNLDALKDVVLALCEPYGELVFLAPMLRGHSGWMSDQ
jgi:hypothetical protein